MKKIALITGASSGIGKEFVRAIDESMSSIDEIWLVARRKDRLEELSGKLNHETRIIAGDLGNKNTVNRIASLLKSENVRVSMLINAAGYGILGDFTGGGRKEECGMIDINDRALTDLCYVCIPYMHRNSRIINLASSAAFVPQPRFSVYAASKSYVLSFSRSLNMELRDKGIYVTAVCPGPVRTEFFDVAEKYGTRKMSIKKATMTTPDVVVKQALKDSFDKKDLSIPTFYMKAFYVICRLFSHRMIMRITKALYK